MFFALGYLAGLATAILIVAVLTFFKKTIEHKTKVIEKIVSSKGPAPKGFIFEAPDEADEARDEIIAKNRAQGKDTLLSDLV